VSSGQLIQLWLQDEKRTLSSELQASNSEKEQLHNTIKELHKAADNEAQRKDEVIVCFDSVGVKLDSNKR